MFPQRLKVLREMRGLYQKDIATLLGLRQNAYSNYETGRAEPSISVLCKLADFFEISIDELVGHVDLHAADNEEADRIATLTSLAKLLDKDDQDRLCKIAKAFIALQDQDDPA